VAATAALSSAMTVGDCAPVTGTCPITRNHEAPKSLAISPNKGHPTFMPLPREYSDVSLSHPCPQCAYEVRKKGSWAQSTGMFTCAGCRTRVRRLTYDAKVKLFADHALKNAPLT
jgi:hypothetical protein